MRALVLGLMLFLAACSTTVEPTKVVDIPKFDPQLPRPVTMYDVRWSVIELDGVAYFGLDDQGYSNLAKNMEELQRFIRQQNEIIDYYREKK